MSIVNTLAVARTNWMKIMNDEMEGFPSVYKSFVREFSTRQSYEDVKTLTGFGLPTLTSEGADPTYDTRRKLYTKSNTPVKWQVAWLQSEESEFKDPNNQISQNARLAGNAMAHGRDKNSADLLNYAFTSGYTGPDSQTFGYTAHPSNGGPTYANCTSTTVGNALNVQTLNSAKQSVRSQVDGKNKRRTPVMQWKLLVGSGLEHTSLELLQTTPSQPFSANNTMNSARHKMNTEPLVVDYWTNNSGLGWMLLPAAEDRNPLFMLKGMPLETKVYDLENGTRSFRTFEEYVHNWFHAYDTWIDLGA